MVIIYNKITRAESEHLPSSWRHCVHIMIHAPVPETHLFHNPQNAIRNTILMQMRFDGRLGFPGGFVDYDDKSLEDAVYRELSEEMGLLPPEFKVTPSDYAYAYRGEEMKFCLHFFIKEVTFEDFLKIETRNGNQDFFGFEVLGAVRVPLYAMSDKRGGFPSFLRNNFIGTSRQELIDGIRFRKLLSEERLNLYLTYSKQFDHMSNTETQNV